MGLLRTVILLLAAGAVTRALAGENAREILDRAKALDDGTRRWQDRHQKVTLTITGRGAERIRELELFDRRYPDDERKSIVFLLSPPDVAGMAFLAFTYRSREADQWMYLPTFHRTRQITAQTRDESFVGSDLTYRDLDILAEMTGWTE